MFAFYTYVQCRVPDEKRQALVEFVTRANQGLWVGNFELDYRDGTIRYKTNLQSADGELTTEMLDALLRCNGNTLDKYLPGVMSILWNDVSAEDAIGLIEAA